jgi:hypothetical protein
MGFTKSSAATRAAYVIGGVTKSAGVVGVNTLGACSRASVALMGAACALVYG